MSGKHSNSEAYDYVMKLEEKKNNNLLFFKISYPALYDYFKEFKSSQKSLSVDMKGGSTILSEGKSLYKHGAVIESDHEVSEFDQVFGEGNHFNSINPPLEENYHFPRFFHKIMNKTIARSPVCLSSDDKTRYYSIPKAFPLLVFMGTGLGFHIQSLLEKRGAQHVIVFERDPEIFFLSLYMVDWKQICAPFTNQSERTIQILVTGTESIDTNWKILWNELIGYYASFPFATFYFNHTGCSVSNSIVDKINKELPSVVSSWGHYDDEFNQLYYSLYNIDSRNRFIGDKVSEQYHNTPVVIVGSGPSYDNKVELIKKYRDRIIVVSCGSSITALFHDDIKPDFHFSLESDYVETDILKAVNHESYLDETVLVASLQVSPFVVNMPFAEKYFFLKEEGLVGRCFSKYTQAYANAAPSCSNSAFSVMSGLGFRRIFLVGLDFGFSSVSQHHSNKSVYYDESQTELLKSVVSFQEDQLLEIESITGTMIKTKPFYYVGKSKIETALSKSHSSLSVYNLSEGAAIKGTNTLDEDEITSLLDSSNEVDRHQFRMSFGQNSNNCVNSIELSGIIQNITKEIQAFCRSLQLLVEQEVQINEDIFIVMSTVRNHMEKVKSSYLYINELIFDSIRHFLYFGLTHAMMNSRQENQLFIYVWANGLLEFLRYVEKDFNESICNRSGVEHDKRLKVSIVEPL